jgi:hypothetical protein
MWHVSEDLFAGGICRSYDREPEFRAYLHLMQDNIHVSDDCVFVHCSLFPEGIRFSLWIRDIREGSYGVRLGAAIDAALRRHLRIPDCSGVPAGRTRPAEQFQHCEQGQNAAAARSADLVSNSTGAS